jgi:hypothetical protein
MVVIQMGVLTYSNCALRSDVVFYSKPHRHLFWRFWVPL